ncbi:MAG: hypothetical protein Crog4KO_29070 [Crocinitomicaceae bacterium]
MKYFVTLLFGISLSCFGQNGGLNLTVLDNPSLGPITVSIYLQEDSTQRFLGITDAKGQIIISDLPEGKNALRFSYLDTEYGYRDFFVQERQMLSTTLLIDTMLDGIDVNNFGKYEIGAGQPMSNARTAPLISRDGGAVGVTITREDIARMSVQSCCANRVMSINEVAVVAYKVPLIDKSGGVSAVSFSQEEIRNMPTRSAGSLATTVGGVQSFSDADGLHVRGARSDATNYYIDGVRVRSMPQIPQTSMSRVTVYTGGVPASYGDFTGGIISVESKSYFDLYRAWEAEQRRKNYYSPPPAPTEVPEVEAEPSDVPETLEVESEPVQVLEPRISADRFHPIYENMFLTPREHPNSTFGLDVDRASWTYVKNAFGQKREVQRDAVKMEEMINAFHYRNIEVPEGELMHVEVVRSECMWNENSELLSVHLKAMDLPRDLPRKSHNFVFLVDVSGSMSWDNKLSLLKAGLKDFVKTLREDDVVSIVTYAGNVGVALKPTSNKQEILKALDNLESGGSTNGIGGIQKAYELAESNLDLEKNNRIILCTDGDFNVGINDPNELEAYISQKRGGGIYLTALGFGMGNYRSDVLESLADRGDGNHFYINSMAESRKVLVEDIGNLLNIARDVKLDVEFDATMVDSYRLIGYENRMLQPEDFVDDTKDGGEIGYGHEVVAVYEVQRIHDSLLIDTEDRIANVRLRYKPFEAQNSIERGYPVYCKDPIERGRKLNTIVGFGLVLRNSAYSNLLTPEEVYNYSLSMRPQDDEDKEVLEMIEQFRDQQIGL